MRTKWIGAPVVAAIVASCSSPQAGVRIRAAIPASHPAGVAEGEAQLALGNVALALEAFRRQAREQPSDVRALVGIARSYERMGRFDLSSKWYEMALAAAPADSLLLQRYAGSLDRQGLKTEAASVRAEVVARDHVAPETAPQLPIVDQPEAVASAAAPSVTLTLPPARPAKPADSKRAESGVSVASLEAQPSSGPRLQRLTGAEVALLTRSGPVWRTKVVERSPQSVTLRFIRVRPAARLLNAARLQGLAARTRASLLQRGWKQLAIGDAPAVRNKTVVFFPQSQAVPAKRLALQLGSAELRQSNTSGIIVLLGRDWARTKSLQPA